MKRKFQKLFPREAKLLSEAKSQEEIDTLHEQFIEEYRHQVIIQLKNAGVSDEDTKKLYPESDFTAPIILSHDTYQTLINATGDTIENKLHVIIDGLERVKRLDKDDPGLITAQLVIAGVLGIGVISFLPVLSALGRSVIEVIATLAGVTATSVGVIVGLVTILIIILLIPIIYFMVKPANCIVFLINELDNDLVFKEEFSVHGKSMVKTRTIPASVVTPEGERYVGAGFFATKKEALSLYGSQYGFVMKGAANNTELSFGVENPLTNMYKFNNCICEFDDSAKVIAKKTDKENKQEWQTTTGNITISIRCNSGHGSITYYIARAYNTPSQK